MSRRVTVLLMIALGLGVVLLVGRLPGMLAGMEVFRVRDVELEGATHLSREEALRASGIPSGASVWDDLSDWEAALAEHPLVREASIRRRLPSTLVMVVEENEPVALLPTPTLEPVDEDGKVLPLDPAVDPLDVPLLEAELRGDARIGVLTGELARLERVEPSFLGEISEAGMDEHGDLIARWGTPPVAFLFRPSVPPSRLREGVRALQDATRRRDGIPPSTIDLRWADQVVVSPR